MPKAVDLGVRTTTARQQTRSLQDASHKDQLQALDRLASGLRRSNQFSVEDLNRSLQPLPQLASRSNSWQWPSGGNTWDSHDWDSNDWGWDGNDGCVPGPAEDDMVVLGGEARDEQDGDDGVHYAKPLSNPTATPTNHCSLKCSGVKSDAGSTVTAPPEGKKVSTEDLWSIIQAVYSSIDRETAMWDARRVVKRYTAQRILEDGSGHSRGWHGLITINNNS